MDEEIDCLWLLVAEGTADFASISCSESSMMSETRSGDNDRLPVRLMDEDDREVPVLVVLSLPRFRSVSAPAFPSVLRVAVLKASSIGSESL